MKKIMFTLCLVTLSNLVQAGTDLKKYSYLDGKSGIGKNAYEEGQFNCHVKVDKNENSISIIHAGAYYGTTNILGSQIASQSTTSTGGVFETTKNDPSKSGLCGDHVSAKSVQQKLEITNKSVSITTSYRCLLIPHKDVMTCSF